MAISFKWVLLISCYCSISSTTMGQQPLVGSETPQPAHLLRPRNFNPHPYQSRSNTFHRQDYIYGQYSPYQYQFLQPYALQSSPERSPYNIIKGQRDYLTRLPSERFQDSQAYSALAKHAQKVLQEQQQQQQQQDQPDPQDYLNRKYAFEYTANDIYHTQQQDDQGLVKGSYEVPLPDGRIQVVTYTADGNGYHPEISYKGEIVAQQQQQQQSAAYSVAPAPQIPLQQQQRPVPIQRGSVVVYPPEEEEEEEEQVVQVQAPKSYYSSTTISSEPQAVQYTNYGLISGLPKPFGTVRTVGVYQSPNQGQPVQQQRYAGRIQYATYEDIPDEEPPSTQLYFQQQ